MIRPAIPSPFERASQIVARLAEAPPPGLFEGDPSFDRVAEALRKAASPSRVAEALVETTAPDRTPRDRLNLRLFATSVAALAAAVLGARALFDMASLFPELDPKMATVPLIFAVWVGAGALLILIDGLKRPRLDEAKARRLVQRLAIAKVPQALILELTGVVFDRDWPESFYLEALSAPPNSAPTPWKKAPKAKEVLLWTGIVFAVGSVWVGYFSMFGKMLVSQW